MVDTNSVASLAHTPGYSYLASVIDRGIFIKAEINFLLRMLIALVLGCLAGFSLDWRGASTMGIRTYGAVSIGAATFSGLATFLYLTTGMGNALQIIGGIITGIGFLCAAVIFKDGNVVKGLTTAATIWATAAIGAACGAGLFVIAFGATAMIILFHLLPRKPFKLE